MTPSYVRIIHTLLNPSVFHFTPKPFNSKNQNKNIISSINTCSILHKVNRLKD